MAITPNINQSCNIRTAITNRDSKALVQASHSFKSLLGNLFAKSAFNATLKLEKTNDENNFDRIEEKFSELEKEINHLKLVFEEWLE